MNPLKYVVCMSISLLIAASAYGAEKIVFGEEQMRKFEKAIDQHAEQQSPRTFNKVHEHFPHSSKAPKNRCQVANATAMQNNRGEKIIFSEVQIHAIAKDLDEQQAKQQAAMVRKRCQSPKGFDYKTKQLQPGAEQR